MSNPDRPENQQPRDPDEPDRVEHRAERRYEVVADPEQVWEVIATADGISSWMLPTRLEPREGGEICFDLGDTTLYGTVSEYAPHRRFSYVEPWPIAERPEALDPGMARWFDSIGVPLAAVYETLPLVGPIATEFLVEAESGGTCVIRVVTSAYGSGADWEQEFFDQMIISLAPMLDRLTTRFPAPAPR